MIHYLLHRNVCVRVCIRIVIILFTSVSYASASDTIYYSRPEEITYDTIPYMLRDTSFIKAFNELKSMMNGHCPYSLKRAEFIVENAYSGGKMSYSKYCHDIDSVTNKLKKFIKEKDIGKYKTSPNYALFEYFTKSNELNGYKPITYDMDDFFGDKDFRKIFITKVMETHTGQCTSMTLYYKILCDELGGQSALAFAPSHIYVKHIGEDGKWVNIELTNGHFMRDEWLIQTKRISTEAIRKGTFLTALNNKENIAFMLLQLGKAYRQKFNSWDYFPLWCAEEVLSVLPNFCDALVLKFCVHQQLGYAYINKYGQRQTRYSDQNYIEFNNMINRLDELGYRQMTPEEYEENIKEYFKIYKQK